MAFYDMSRPTAHGRLSRVVGRLYADFHAWRDARANRDALSKLTDQELYDIGLMRGNLDLDTGDDLRNG